MRQVLTKLKQKYPMLLRMVKGLGLVLQKFNRNLALVVKCNKYDRQLYKLFDQFCVTSGLKNRDINCQHIDEKCLNTNHIDDKIETIILQYYQNNKAKFLIDSSANNDKKIGACFTELYTVGGHTPLVERFVESFHKEYDLEVFCTRLHFTQRKNYKQKHNNVCTKIQVKGVNWNFGCDKMSSLVVNLYNQIIESKRDILFCWIHPHDIILSATLCLIKNTTNIQIVDVNIQDHFHGLGFRFAHLIIDARPSGQRITTEVRGYKNTILMPMQREQRSKTVYFTAEEKQALREKLGIKSDEYCTLTGASDYKIFEENGSQYLQTIKELLVSEPKLKHVLMVKLSPKYEAMLADEFKDSKNILSRLVIIDIVPDFDIYMQACDLFIDSFPQGGASIHIDIMRNKRPTVLKINKENPVRSFEYYLPTDYEYQYETVEDMKAGIFKLLYSKEEQQEASEKLYQYYLDNYEFEIVKTKYKELIDGSSNLEQFFGRNFYEN